MKHQSIKTFFDSLNREVSLIEFELIYNKKVYFKDPFHEVDDVAGVYQVFQQMYLNLDEPGFKVIEVIGEGSIAYAQWEFSFKFKGQSQLRSFMGVSRLVFDDQGKIKEHIDFWDAASTIYESLPLIGALLKWVKQKIQKR